MLGQNERQGEKDEFHNHCSTQYANMRAPYRTAVNRQSNIVNLK